MGKTVIRLFRKTIIAAVALFVIACMITNNDTLAAKTYELNNKATMSGKLVEVKFSYAGETQVNYMLMLNKSVKIDGETVKRVSVNISKKQWKKYKNKKVKVTGGLYTNSGYYASTFGLYNVTKIQKQK